MTRDPYGYAGANPINRTDPTGLCERHDGIWGAVRDVACEIGEGDPGDAVERTVEFAGDGAELVGRCALDALTCLDNIKVALAPVIVAGLTVTAGFGLVAACATLLGCLVAAPILGTAVVGGAWATWETMQELWFRDGHDRYYHPLGEGHDSEHQALGMSMLEGGWC